MSRRRPHRTEPVKIIAASIAIATGLIVSCDGGEDGRSTTEVAAVTEAPVTTEATEPSVTSTAQPEGAEVTDVAIDTGDLTLVGDLYLPEGEGPHPGVVLVHGSGPQNRNQEVPGQLNMAFGFTIPVFAELAEGLQSAGYAVLTYDKRSCGDFNGCADNDYPIPPHDLTIDRFIDDAAAAVNTLGDLPEVDADRLAVIGHSQGAGFVPELLTENTTIRGGVLLAGAHDPPDVLVSAQAESTRELLETMGMSEEQIGAAVAPLDAAADQLAAVRAGEAADGPILGASAEFWASWMNQADAAPGIAVELDRALLIVGGGLDTNVPPSHAEHWRRTLESSSVDHEVVVLACITHALNCLTESDLLALSPEDIGQHVAPEVVKMVVAYLDRHL